MRVVLLTTDNREHFKDYGAAVPYFGTAPEALLQGFTFLREVTVHVVSCARARMKSPAKLAPNVFFHSLYVSKLGWMRTAYQGCIRAVRQKLRHIQPHCPRTGNGARLRHQRSIFGFSQRLDSPRQPAAVCGGHQGRTFFVSLAVGATGKNNNSSLQRSGVHHSLHAGSGGGLS